MFKKYFPDLFIWTFIFYIFKSALWPITYLFIGSYVICILLFFYQIRLNIALKTFLKAFLVPLVLVAIYIIVFLLEGNYKDIFLLKSLFRIAVLLSLFYILLVSLKRGVVYSKEKILKYIVLTTAFIALINILNPFIQKCLPIKVLQFLKISGGFTIATDKNFFILLILLSITIINYYKIEWKIKLGQFIMPLLNILFVLTILTSGSRRGILVSLLMLIFYFFYSYGSLRKKIQIKHVIVYSIIIVSIISSFLFVLRELPKEKVTALTYKYANILGINDYYALDQYLWGEKIQYIPNGNIIIDKKIFTEYPRFWLLPENKQEIDNPEIKQVNTPYGEGYKIKKTYEGGIQDLLIYKGPEILYYANHTYEINFKVKVSKGNVNKIRIAIKTKGWYINEGKGSININRKIKKINDDWFQVTANYTFNNNHFKTEGFLFTNDVSEIIITDFTLKDLTYNSQLPKFYFESNNKLKLKNWMNHINPPLINDTSLVNNGNFYQGLKYWSTSAKNVIITAESKEGKTYARIKRGSGQRGYFSLLYVGSTVSFKKNNSYKISMKVKPIKPKNEIVFNIGFWVDEGSGFIHNLNKEIDTLEDGWYLIKAKYKFKNDHKNIAFPICGQKLNTEFLITDIKLENITQKQLIREGLVSNKNINRFSSPRTERWLYALDLWKTEYKWNHKLFGHGFDQFKWYGKKFQDSEKSYDYPHNPFISVLLYSGILGLVMYIILLVKVVLIYFKYRREYAIVFIGFFISFFFSFFSSFNPFDPPIMGLFMLFPFLINYIHKKDKSV